MTAIGDRKTNRWHLQIAERWVVQYNFYINDRRWGRMFVRMCPYLPFSARVCLNQHQWLANRMREEDLDFQQCSNAFLRCSTPQRLQQRADTLPAEDLASCGRKWLARLTPFFTETERKQAGCQHRLFFSQVEFCDNLIFHRRAALDKLGERLLDANGTIGQPNKITVIFGRKIPKQYRGKLQPEIEDMHLPNPVIRSHYRNGFIKQYVRDHLILRAEAATNNVTDYGVNKAVEHLPALRDKLSAIDDSYLDIQQDILETFIDRGHLQRLARPTVTPSGKRIPGLKLENPRQLALMHALQTARTFGRWDCINARQRERAKGPRFAAWTSLLTSPATRRPPPKCGAFRLQPRGSLLRQTVCWREPDSNPRSHPTARPDSSLEESRFEP